jgi:phage terminase Nu1 subunit (DNA packaging protein)
MPQSPITARDIDYLRSLPSWDLVRYLLLIASQSPETAWNLRLLVEPGTPTGYFDGFTKEETARFFGVGPQCIDGWVRAGMPIQRRGRRPDAGGRYQRSGFNLQECAEWVASNKTSRLEASTDEMKAADLEFRLEKTRVAELKRRQLEGQLVDADVVRRTISEMAAMIRKAAEAWHRTYGNELVDDLNRLMDEVETKLAASLGASQTDEPTE